jgi:transcriptional regulator with XRE-family HTH domain
LERRLTQKQLAERLSVSPHYLMSIENKRQIPSCDLLFRIIRVLEIPADIIFYPEHGTSGAEIKKLQILLNKCNEQDISVIIGIIQTLLQSKNTAGSD